MVYWALRLDESNPRRRRDVSTASLGIFGVRWVRREPAAELSDRDVDPEDVQSSVPLKEPAPSDLSAAMPLSTSRLRSQADASGRADRKLGSCQAWSRKLTFDASLPYCVGVSETRDDVVADREGKLQPVMATFLQGKPHDALGVWSHRKWEDDVRPSGRDD
ncbi:hypothetical protein GW17_00042367 [Ensete ventricosum]|nr:hypothetical protein GW17_00042367 [Ensete ventricosum]